MAWYLWVHEKYPTELFFRFETGLPEWIFQIWSKIVKSDRVFVYMKKSLFWAFWGPAKVSRPLVITKAGAGSEKPPKNWIGRSGRPKMRGMNFWPVLRRNLKNFGFYWPNHGRQIFVVQIPNLSVFGLFEVFLNNKIAFGLVGQPKQPAHKKFRPIKLKCRFF